MKLFEQITNIVFDVISDINSSINRARYFLIHSSEINKAIFLIIAFIVLCSTYFRSNNTDVFLINLVIILFTTLASFYIFASSDTFWFLIKKGYMYQYNINHKKNIFPLIQKVEKDENQNVGGSIEDQIHGIAKFNSVDYKTFAMRYAIEISFFLIILLYASPLFFFFNVALICWMFVYVFLYEQQSVNQVFNDISTLIFLIDKFNRQNSDRCKRFIMKNEREEVRNLTKLYGFIVNNK